LYAPSVRKKGITMKKVKTSAKKPSAKKTQKKKPASKRTAPAKAAAGKAVSTAGVGDYPNYLSDLRPDFSSFEIDCGTIPAYRFKGNLRTELKAGALDRETAIDLLEDMLMVREMEQMIVKLRSGAYEPIAEFDYRGPTHVSIGQEGTSVGACAALTNADYITSTHRGHGDSLARGCQALRTMTDDQ